MDNESHRGCLEESLHELSRPPPQRRHGNGDPNSTISGKANDLAKENPEKLRALTSFGAFDSLIFSPPCHPS